MAEPMTMLAVVGTVLSVGGQVMGAMQQNAEGEAQARAMEYRAAAERRQANDVQAVAQRRAIETQRKAAYVLSAERAEAAAGGGGASDPTIISNEAGIIARGEYGTQSDLYIGKSQAAGLETQAGLDTWQAGQAREAGRAKMIGGLVTALGSGMKQGVSLRDKYGSDLKPIDTGLSSTAYRMALYDRYGGAFMAGT